MSEGAPNDLNGLWNDYKATGDLALRNRLVLQYSPLVKHIAARVGVGLPAHVDQADLVSDGLIGLMDAIDKFAPERGLQFPTYAVSRIRGAIIDSLRAADWVPRTTRYRLRAIERSQWRLEAELGRPPTEAELAADLDLSLRDLRDAIGRSSYTTVFSLDELGSGDLAGDLGDGHPDHEEAVEDDAVRATLARCLRELPGRDQVVVALYYFEDLSLGEIGQVLGVSESRVSQLHTRIVLALQTKLTPAVAA